jgi:hypothetical protein
MDTSEKIKDLLVLTMRRRRMVWRPYMEKYKCEIIAELGVSTGRNFYNMIAHGPALAVAVDAWGWGDEKMVSQNDCAFTQEEFDSQYETFRKEMAPFSFVKIYREYTFDAAKRFPNGSFDFVYIDADHSYNGCMRDLVSWWPKLKHGATFVGDDYYPGIAKRTKVPFRVIEAVNDFAKANDLLLTELPGNAWAIIKP